MRKIILVVLTLGTLFTGCMNDAKEVEKVDNSDFTLELLFEKDGCKIYRFYDGGTFVYWTDCRGKVEYDHTTSNGKQTHTERIQNETSTK